MSRRICRPSPALAVAALALFAALGGTVYAAGRIDGRTIRVRSLPGNRLRPHSLPASRLDRRLLARLRGAPSSGLQIGGAQIDERSLGQVPSADYADSAGVAQTANEARVALAAVDAVDAGTVNGHSAGCREGTAPFAGACWQASSSESAATAPAAAAACAALGGALPEALQLAAFAAQPDVKFNGDEWSSDIANVSGPGYYSVVTVNGAGEINYSLSTNTNHYRCVFPIVA